MTRSILPIGRYFEILKNAAKWQKEQDHCPIEHGQITFKWLEQ